jgi:hypothetical protein
MWRSPFLNEELDILFDILSSNIQSQYQRKSRGCMMLGTSPEYISDISGDNLIPGYLIDRNGC